MNADLTRGDANLHSFDLDVTRESQARQRAELYAREAGFRTARILTISEGGGCYPVAGDVVVTGYFGGGAMAPPPPPPAPVQAGEMMTIGISLSVQFALER